MIAVLTHQPQNTVEIVADKAVGLNFAVRLIEIQIHKGNLHRLSEIRQQLLEHYFIYTSTVLSEYITETGKKVEISYVEIQNVYSRKTRKCRVSLLHIYTSLQQGTKFRSLYCGIRCRKDSKKQIIFSQNV